MEIRRAGRADVPHILDIYNEAVLTTLATFDTVPRTLEQQLEWFEQHGEAYPVVVAEDAGLILGWAALNRYSDRLAYARTAELSLYIRDGRRGQGPGKSCWKPCWPKGKRPDCIRCFRGS
ncbi:GNAT family N-acetyltransferase [Paenibacillus elgii]